MAETPKAKQYVKNLYIPEWDVRQAIAGLAKDILKTHLGTPRGMIGTDHWREESCMSCAFCLPSMRAGRRTLLSHLKPNLAGCKRACHVSYELKEHRDLYLTYFWKILQTGGCVMQPWVADWKDRVGANCGWLMGSMDASWETNWGTNWKDSAWSSVGLHPEELFWMVNVTPEEGVDSQISTGIVSSQWEREFSILWKLPLFGGLSGESMKAAHMSQLWESPYSGDNAMRSNSWTRGPHFPEPVQFNGIRWLSDSQWRVGRNGRADTFPTKVHPTGSSAFSLSISSRAGWGPRKWRSHRLEEARASNVLWSRVLPPHLAPELIQVACDMGEKYMFTVRSL